MMRRLIQKEKELKSKSCLVMEQHFLVILPQAAFALSDVHYAVCLCGGYPKLTKNVPGIYLYILMLGQ